MTWLGVARLAPGAIDFLPGPGPRTLDLPGFPAAGIQICYEVIFPAAVVDEGHRPAWIVNISNDAWFGAWGPPQHLAQARLRAIEEGLPIARVTPTGISAMIDANGRVVASIGPHKAATLSLRVPPPHPPTLFARFAHWASFAFALALLAGALCLRRRI
jgi:apolipoprotein N-acyltransferase